MEKLFQYNESKVRTEIDENDDFWFAGIDVCNILEYANSTQVIEKLDEDERKLDYLTDSSGQRRKTWTINESGLYSLMLSSEKPEAKSFKRWITHDVLPALRKAGIYSTDVLNRKNAMIQELVKNIEGKNTAITNSKTTTKRLEKERNTMQIEFIQLLKSNPDQTTVYPDEIWDGIKKEINKQIKEEE
ncbi:MAG: Bro-N domain-containing protein [Bacteroidota bacterium]|nr:Bro-N domain-containing protein [Bacteroidota bacterium]